jgi:hypothetical protein
MAPDKDHSTSRADPRKHIQRDLDREAVIAAAYTNALA